MLHPFGEEIWLADGPAVAVAGFVYPTRMAVIRLPGKRLFIWSPIALADHLRAEVDDLGKVSFLAAPNSLHHTWLSEWRNAYPATALCAPPGLRQRRQDLRFDLDLGDAPDPQWAESLDQVQMRGCLITTEVVFFHRPSGTVLVTDLIQHFAPGAFSGWRALVARLDLMTAAEPQTPRKFRAAFVDRRSARAALARILAWPAERVVMAHAEPVAADGRAFLTRAFGWLGRGTA
jgi:hypothetical protein